MKIRFLISRKLKILEKILYKKSNLIYVGILIICITEDKYFI